MAVAHIVVTVEENDDVENPDYVIRMSYSGGHDLVLEQSIITFDRLTKQIHGVLQE